MSAHNRPVPRYPENISGQALDQSRTNADDVTRLTERFNELEELVMSLAEKLMAKGVI